MNFTEKIAAGVKAAVAKLYDHEIDTDKVMITNTRKEFAGDYTVVVFPFTKAAKKKPVDIFSLRKSFFFEDHGCGIIRAKGSNQSSLVVKKGFIIVLFVRLRESFRR